MPRATRLFALLRLGGGGAEPSLKPPLGNFPDAHDVGDYLYSELRLTDPSPLFFPAEGA